MTKEHEDSRDSLSAAEQQERIWSTLMTYHESLDSVGVDSRQWPTYDAVLSDVANSDYNDTLKCPYDMKNGTGEKGKTLCPYGVVCCAQLELFNSPPFEQQTYTGLLTPGTNCYQCILRLSSAMKPPKQEIKSRVGRALLYATGDKLRNAKLFPTAALKVFRDNGVQSGNLLFGGCKVGQREEDFFAHCMCTQMTEKMPIAVKPFVKKFWKYSDYPLSLGLSEFCSVDQSGNFVGVDEIMFPYSLVLSPSSAIGFLCERQQNRSSSANTPNDSDSFDSFLDTMVTIPEGTVLYDLFACPNPESVPDPSKLQRIGRIVSTSKMQLSNPTDGLFFRHQRKEEDFELRPEWKEGVQSTCSINDQKAVGPVSKMAGWKLFEGHIGKGVYVDFEALSKD